MSDFIPDELDQTVDDPRRGSGRFQRINFLSASNEPRYADTCLQTGGFQIPVREGVQLPDDRSAFEEVSLGKDGIALAAKRLNLAVIGVSPQVRRYVVEVDDTRNGQQVKSAAGHIDIAPSFWREIRNTDFGKSLQAMNKQGKLVDPKSHTSVFVVMQQQPDRVWEIGLKGGNANIPRDLDDALFTLADMQTRRIGELRGKPYSHTLGYFVNFVPFTTGATMAYSARTDGGEAGGFTRFSIGWPNIPSIAKFQRQFTRMDQFGEKVNAMQELSEGRKSLTAQDLEAMFVGSANYARFFEMRKELDELMANGYIKSLSSQTDILDAIEEVKRAYFERSIAINRNQLPAAPAGDDIPFDRDSYEDTKRDAAQNPPAPKAQPAPTGSAGPWDIKTMKNFKKNVILHWAEADDAAKSGMVSNVNVQYMSRFDDPPEWKGEPDAKQVAKVLQNCIDFDEINEQVPF